MAGGQPTRYSRAMGLLLLVFVLLPLADLYLLVQLGAWVGALPVMAWVIASAVVGVSLARKEGLRVVRRWQQAVSKGEVPEDGLVSGLLVLGGGVLLVLPGLLTDLVGLALLAPPSRRAIVRWLRRRLERAVRAGRVRVVTSARGAEMSWPQPKARGGETDAEFEESPPDRPQLPR